MTKDEMTIFIKKVAGLSVEDDEANLVIPENPDDDDDVAMGRSDDDADCGLVDPLKWFQSSFEFHPCFE